MTDKKSFPNKDISFAIGDGFNLGRAKNRTESFAKFRRRFKAPHVTGEARHEFLKLSDKRKAFLKSQAGWFMRAGVDRGKRNRNSILPGDLITFDADYLTPEHFEELTNGEILPGVCFFLHTTRSHTPENPRARIILPVRGQISAEDYIKASRIIRTKLDPDGVFIDKVSFRPAQMMFFPTVSRDMEKHYTFYEQPGELIDWREEVARWEEVNGSADVLSNLPTVKGEEGLRESALEAEDPLEKSGLVGNFCRAYSITDLIDGIDDEPGILSGYYEPTQRDNAGCITRATYLHGTTSDGAVIYDDKFLYSHHGSDPAQDQLMNAFDLVRTHLFHEKDEKEDPDTPVTKLPSWKAMAEFCEADNRYKIAVVEERYDEAAMFDDDDDRSWIQDATEDDEIEALIGPVTGKSKAIEDEEIEDLLGVPLSSIGDYTPQYQRLVAEKPPKKWVATELELTQDGVVRGTLHNVATIVTNDARFFRKIAFNEFSNQIVLLADIRSRSKVIPTVVCRDKIHGSNWTDMNDIVIRAIIEAPNGKGKPGYGFKVNDRDLIGGIKLAARNNAFHPIREQLERWRAMGWDGKPRVETFLQRYVGAEDSVYMREVFKLMLIASIERIENPGCKFDYALILEGAQGIGKSTMIRLLYGDRYFGEIDVELKDRGRVAEQISGKWGLELPELSALHKSEHNDAKHFMRRTEDSTRLAYDRTVTELPRQCVFYGTTNDSKYLRDPTGNRSYWVVRCSGAPIDFAGIMRERDQLWAEAVHLRDEWRKAQPGGDLPLTLKGEALKIAQTLQERARKKELHEDWFIKIGDWMDEPVALRQVLEENGFDSAVFDHNGLDPDTTMVQRVGFSQGTALKSALDFGRETLTDPVRQIAWNSLVELMSKDGWVQKNTRLGGKFGRKQRIWLRPDVTTQEMADGYRLIEMDTSDESETNGDDLI